MESHRIFYDNAMIGYAFWHAPETHSMHVIEVELMLPI
jgi:hypothetical protein